MALWMVEGRSVLCNYDVEIMPEWGYNISIITFNEAIDG
jgi:hypothetical protein